MLPGALLRQAAGAAGVAASASRGREPTSMITCWLPEPDSCAASSTIREYRFCWTQSTTKRFGASRRRTPSESTACRGRTQVLNCCSGTSPSSWRRQRCQSEPCTSQSPWTVLMTNDWKGREVYRCGPLRARVIHRRAVRAPQQRSRGRTGPVAGAIDRARGASVSLLTWAEPDRNLAPLCPYGHVLVLLKN